MRATRFGAPARRPGTSSAPPSGGLAVLFTDAETSPFNAQAIANELSQANAELVVVRFWRPGEQVRPAGLPSRTSRTPASADHARQLAEAAGGRAYDEDDLDGAIRSAREVVGEGETVVRTVRTDIDPLALHVVLLAAPAARVPAVPPEPGLAGRLVPLPARFALDSSCPTPGPALAGRDQNDAGQRGDDADEPEAATRSERTAAASPTVTTG